MEEKKIKVTLTAELGDFKSKMSEAKKEVSGTANEIKKTWNTANDGGKQTGNIFQRTWAKIKGDSKSGTDQMKNGMNDVKGSTGGLSSALGSVGKVIAGAFAVNKVIDFGSAMVESAASTKAMNAQFDQVFGDAKGQAEDMVNNLSSSFSMVPNRIKPAFTQMTSQFKGLGMGSQEAMEMAASGVQIAADAAAFYDTSMESAQGSLNSFIKGNYEGGEAIGLFANDSQMAQFAVQQGIVGSTKEWAKLDEATKQATRLEYAKNMQEQGGAAGQAAREADGWENVMGNLKQTWSDFLAIIGAPVLSVVSSVVQGITDAFTWLNEKMGGTNSIGQETSGIFDQIGTVVQQVGQWFVESFTSISEVAVPILESAIEVINGAINGIVQFIQDVMSGDNGVANSFMKAFQSILDVAVPILEDAATFIGDIIDSITQFWRDNGDQIVSAVQNAFSIVSSIISTVMGIIQPLIQGAWENIKVYFKTALDIIMGVIKLFSSVFTGDWKGAFEAIKSITSSIWNAIKAVFSNTLNAIKGVVSNVINFIKPFITNAWNAIKSATSSVWEGIKSAISNAINSAKDIVSSVVEGVKSTVSGVWDSIKSTTSSVWEGIKSAITSPIEKAKEIVSGIIDKFKSMFDFKISFPKPSLPHIKLPHFSISGSFNPLKGELPKLGLDWYQKGGIFGGSRDGQVVGLGENHGTEAIVPLSKRSKMAPFASAIASMMPERKEENSNSGNGSVIINVDSVIVREEKDIKKIAQELFKLEQRERKGRGKAYA